MQAGQPVTQSVSHRAAQPLPSPDGNMQRHRCEWHFCFTPCMGTVTLIPLLPSGALHTPGHISRRALHPCTPPCCPISLAPVCLHALLFKAPKSSVSRAKGLQGHMWYMVRIGPLSPQLQRRLVCSTGILNMFTMGGGAGDPHSVISLSSRWKSSSPCLLPSLGNMCWWWSTPTPMLCRWWALL